jgi:hypothetical protein
MTEYRVFDKYRYALSQRRYVALCQRYMKKSQHSELWAGEAAKYSRKIRAIYGAVH